MLLNLKSKANIYEQIVFEYEKLINIGALEIGERLPSCRALASEYGINPNTVEKAYHELIRLGYIKSLPKKGFFVANRDLESKLHYVRAEISKLYSSGIEYETLLGIIKEVYSKEDDIND